MSRHRPSKQTLIAVLSALACVAGLLTLRNATLPAPLEKLQSEALEDGRSAYSGSIHFPRGGPYMLGFESPAAASLAIDGRVLLRGAGEKPRRIVFEAGVYSIRFEAPRGARLLWHPPGRRGPLEYVPASSLAPDAPKAASFGAGAGAARQDGMFALLILGVLVALLLFLLRERLRRIDRQVAIGFALVFALALAIRLFDLGGAGQTWDEDVNWTSGRNYVQNLLSLDFRQASWRWNLEHPPVTKYAAGVGALFADGYGPARAVSALLMALGCALLVPIGARLYAPRVGLVAGALAALTPHLIAHGKVVGHEAPTVLLWSLAIWAALRAHDGGPERLVRRLVLVGLILGLAISTRFVNLLLAPLLGAILLAEAPAAERRRTVLLGLSILPAAAVVMSVALWPRLWSQPILHLQESWAVLKGLHTPEPFLGQLTNRPPRYYFAVYLFATAPLALLLGAGAWAWRGLARRRRSDLIVLMWLAAPLLVALSPVRQDGVRYIMPALAALSLAAAAGLDFAAGALARLWPRAKAAALPALAGLSVLYLALVSARIHPYYLDYYGAQVGGPERVARARLFEIAWWGEGLDRAIAYVNREAPRGARVHKCRPAPMHLFWLRADLWAGEARQPEGAEWILDYAPTSYPCRVPGDADLVYEVSVRGAPLARVYRRVLNR